MFDPKSDYALNKMDPEAIVCKSVTGEYIRLICEDFASKEEFDTWKKWSDRDYCGTEATGRDFYDNCLSLSEAENTTGISAEDAFFTPLLQAERKEQQADLLQQIKNVLTETQYRRLWMYCVDAKTVEEIAAIEHIAHQNVSKSIRAAWSRIEKFLRQL